MKTSGARGIWLQAIASQIMDGGDTPPSFGHLTIAVPSNVGPTNINDGHCTSAAVFGEEARNDYKKGQVFIIREMLDLLRAHNLVNGDDNALHWVAERDGIWELTNDEERKYLIRGQRERRLSEDRHMIGERDEETGAIAAGPPPMIAAGAQPFQVQAFVRGKLATKHYEIHPFALCIPPMTEREREALRDSIVKDGVKVPITIYQNKVLDGRNRVYFASILKKPVHITEFTGTDDEARRHIAILNLVRRHLTAIQRAVVYFELFGKAAMEQSKEALIQGRVKGGQIHSCSPPFRAESNRVETVGPDRNGEWHEIAAKMVKETGVDISPKTLRDAKAVSEAPETRTRVMNGEITGIKAAHAAAKQELQQQPQEPKKRKTTCNQRLKKVIKECEEIKSDISEPLSEKTLVEMTDQLAQIKRLVDEITQEVLHQRDQAFSKTRHLLTGT